MDDRVLRRLRAVLRGARGGADEPSERHLGRRSGQRLRPRGRSGRVPVREDPNR